MSRPSDVAFSDAVKAVQTRNGSRQAYARMEQGAGWHSEVTDELAAFVGEQTSFFLATANSAGQPYIQHRGGPKGFLRVLGPTTLGFADFRGNRQYISIGNLTENPNVHLFLIDYAEQRRVKIWGQASVVERDAELLAKLALADYDARVERAIVVRITAWDANCPQHIPQRIDAADAIAAIETRDRRIAELEAQLRSVRSPNATNTDIP